MGLKNTWPEITGSQKLNQLYNKNNKYRVNLKNKF